MTVPRWTIALAMLVIAGAPAALYAQTDAQPEGGVEVPTPPGEAAETEVVGGATLYQRLGGYDAIAEAVDDVLKRMSEDERLKRFFQGASEKELRRIRQKTVDFFCEKTGGPCFYIGRGIAEAHEDSGITEADWERASELMVAVLDARGLQGELRDEIGGFIAGLREDVVDE